MSLDLMTRKLPSGKWRAWMEGSRSIFEEGSTETQAVGKLIMTVSEMVGISIQRQEPE